MTPEIAANLNQLRALCVQHGVRRLWVFGSSVSNQPGAFRPESDVDLLVEFLDQDLGPWMRRYFDFKSACEELLGRSVDLMLASAPNPPAIRAIIDANKVPVYAAA